MYKIINGNVFIIELNKFVESKQERDIFNDWVFNGNNPLNDNLNTINISCSRKQFYIQLAIDNLRVSVDNYLSNKPIEKAYFETSLTFESDNDMLKEAFLYFNLNIFDYLRKASLLQV